VRGIFKKGRDKNNLEINNMFFELALNSARVDRQRLAAKKAKIKII
jgi:hypothetical protein